MYHEQNSSHTTRESVLLFSGRISPLSHPRQPAEQSSKTLSPDQGQASSIAICGVGRKKKKKKCFFWLCFLPPPPPRPLPVPPPSFHHSHPIYLFFLSDRRATFGLFQTADVNHQDGAFSFYTVGLCRTMKHFCRFLVWAIDWVKTRSSKSRVVSWRQLLSLRLLWHFLFIFV